MRKTFYYSILIILISYLVVFFCILYEPNKDDIKEKESIHCFEDFEYIIKHSSDSLIDISSIIDCFDWDSLMFCDRGEYEKYLDLNYKIIPFNNVKRKIDSFDGDEGWYYIYFYKNNLILDDALAIHYNVLDVEKNLRKNSKFNVKYAKNSFVIKLISNTSGASVFGREGELVHEKTN